MKQCTKCQKYLPYCNFGKKANAPDGQQYWCKQCRNDDAKQYRKHGAKGVWGKRRTTKENHYIRTYGITLQDKLDMIAAQDNKCAICKTDLLSLPDANVHVDHCHTTGKVRGILCLACNHGLGRFDDSPEALRAAADYIEFYS
jgi:hypothetical protein